MSLMSRLAIAGLLAFGTVVPTSTLAGNLTISVAFGPTAEVPDPRAGYNGWMSNQMGRDGNPDGDRLRSEPLPASGGRH